MMPLSFPEVLKKFIGKLIICGQWEKSKTALRLPINSLYNQNQFENYVMYFRLGYGRKTNL